MEDVWLYREFYKISWSLTFMEISWQLLRAWIQGWASYKESILYLWCSSTVWLLSQHRSGWVWLSREGLPKLSVRRLSPTTGSGTGTSWGTGNTTLLSRPAWTCYLWLPTNGSLVQMWQTQGARDVSLRHRNTVSVSAPRTCPQSELATTKWWSTWSELSLIVWERSS